MRLIYILITTLLLAALLVVLVSAQTPSRLVTIPYEGWDQLQAVASQGLQIINYQGNILAALAQDGQIHRLGQSGVSVRVLDRTADTELYYLAYPPEGMDGIPPSAVQAAYPYLEGVYIIKAMRESAEALTLQGVQIVKLPHSVTLQRAEGAAAALDRGGRAADSAQASLAYQAGIQEMVDAVSPTLMIDHVCKLQDDDDQAYCNEVGTRYSYATVELNKAAEYLYNEYAALGLTVSYAPFSYGTYPMNNVVAELPGVGPDSDHIYIICAHYDSISRSPFVAAPGADDNGSGVAAVLEAARILSQFRFNRTIRFVNFAGEEQGLIGSAHYAAEAANRGDWIDGVINLDMIAYESVPPNDHIVEVHAGTNPASIAIADALISNVAEYGLQLVPQKLTSGATTRSDHASFWNNGYPAILGIEDFQDFNPYYHSTSDTLAHMQTAMMVEYTKACVATLAELAAEWQDETATPTPTATPTWTSTATTTPSVTPSATPTTTATPSVTPTTTATPSSTPTPTAVETTVVLQDSTQDTYIYQYAPARNYCTVDLLLVGYKQQNAALLWFDLSSIPSGADVVRATLQLYAAGWGGSDITFGSYVISRTVSLCETTWNQAANGENWGVAGAGDITTDRRASAESSVTTSGIAKWYGLDLTQAVQAWVDGSLANHGLLLRASYSTSSFRFASAENSASQLRPRLIITYRTAGGVPATRTATPTATATQTLTPVPTHTVTPTPTASATTESGGGETSVVLQGSNEDTYIYQYAADVNYCTSSLLKVGYKQQNAALLRFDLSAIPTNATVTRADLELCAVGWGGADISVGAYGISHTVNLCQSTWNRSQSAILWGQPGANDTHSDRRALPESTVTTAGASKWYIWDVTELAQEWVNGGTANHGVLLRAAYSASSFYFASVESGTAARRPRLVLTYRLP